MVIRRLFCYQIAIRLLRLKLKRKRNLRHTECIRNLVSAPAIISVLQWDFVQLYLTRMHSSRMCTVRSSSCLSRGGLPQRMLGYHHPPGSRPPWTRHPPGSRHPPTRHPPLGADPPDQATTPPPERMTDTCKNITFATSLRTVMIIVVLRNIAHLHPIVNNFATTLDCQYHSMKHRTTDKTPTK